MAVPGTQGFTSLAATVEEINEGLAVVIDQFGKSRIVRSDLTSGRTPQVGDSWVIGRVGGYWTFQTLLSSTAPLVASLADLVQALADAGVITLDPSFRLTGGGTFYG